CVAWAAWRLSRYFHCCNVPTVKSLPSQNALAVRPLAVHCAIRSAQIVAVVFICRNMRRPNYERDTWSVQQIRFAGVLDGAASRRKRHEAEFVNVSHAARFAWLTSAARIQATVPLSTGSACRYARHTIGVQENTPIRSCTKMNDQEWIDVVD